VPSYSLTDPFVATFVVIPIALVAAYTVAAYWASVRDGAPRARATRRAAVAAAVAAAWMALTWMAAQAGFLAEWDRMPPPLALLVTGILTVAAVAAFSPAG
jgi:predicted secreted protein